MSRYLTPSVLERFRYLEGFLADLEINGMDIDAFADELDALRLTRSIAAKRALGTRTKSKTWQKDRLYELEQRIRATATEQGISTYPTTQRTPAGD